MMLLKILLRTALVLVVGGVLFLGWLIFQGARQARAYARLTDTHDLGARIDRKAESYCARHKHARLVIGILQNGRKRVQAYGAGLPEAADTPAGQTLFEIGSVTKVFTGVLLARLEADGRLGLDDPITSFLPADVLLPEPARAITLRQLATHTSGLPRLPANLDLAPAKAANPYRDYHADDLYAALRAVKLDREPGKKSVYSNFGVGLLGHLLGLRAGLAYPDLVERDVTGPLGLADTTATLSDDQRRRLAPGHDPRSGQVVPNWDFDALAAAGALRSTADDLLTFLEQNLDPPDSPLGRALVRAQDHHHGNTSQGQGLGWQIQNDPFARFVLHWHNGGTGGYVSFIGFAKTHKVGVVLLSSSGDAFTGDSAVDQMGFQILREASKVSLEPEP